VFGRGKATHIRPNLCNDGRSGHLLNGKDTFDELDGFLKGTQALLNLLLDLFNRLFNEVDVSQDPLQQKAMMGLDAAIEGLAQGR
jgi:hypothetical protein